VGSNNLTNCLFSIQIFLHSIEKELKFLSYILNTQFLRNPNQVYQILVSIKQNCIFDEFFEVNVLVFYNILFKIIGDEFLI